MSYQFKVGDKGKTVAGREYEVIAIELRARASNQLVILLQHTDGSNYVTSRYIDGRFYEDVTIREHALLPPPKTVWEVSFERINNLSTSVDLPTPIATTHTYANEKDARKMFESYTSAAYFAMLKNVKLTPREVQPE